MRKFLLFIACFLPFWVVAQPLQPFVDQYKTLAILQGAWWGGLACYTDHCDEELFTVAADTRFTPASTLKLLTTAAALQTFGPEHRFNTYLYASRLPDENGVLHGDLFLQGGGDMTLGSKRVKGAETYQNVLKKWVKAVQDAGIKQINGSVYADVSIFEGPSVADKVNWENMGNYFAAPASALSFNDNAFEIRFAGELTHNKLTRIAAVQPQIDRVEIQNFVRTNAKNKKDNAYVYGAPDQYNLKIFGTIPTTLSGFSIKAAMPNPALFTVQAFKQALEQEGIMLSGTPALITDKPDYSSMEKLYTYQSPALKDIIYIINKRSFNLYADILLRHLALANGQKGSIQNGLRALRKFLLENKLAQEQDTVLYDGSGLARDNLLTPRVLVNTLTFMTQSPYFSHYYNSLATPNDRGDLLVLRHFLKPKNELEKVRIKGGTIDGVKALAGYVPDANGRPIAFALIANNLATNKDESLWRFHENIIKQMMQTNKQP